MFWRALLEGRYQSGQKAHQIGLNWLCVLADISKWARQIISLFKFVDSTMNFGLYFVFQCLWTFFIHWQSLPWAVAQAHSSTPKYVQRPLSNTKPHKTWFSKKRPKKEERKKMKTVSKVASNATSAWGD